MRILLDEQLPRRLRRALPGHDVQTSQQQGWSGIKNGELLRRASESGFDVFLTSDRSIPFQQNLSRFPLAVVIFVAPSNKIEDLLPLIPRLLQILATVRPGETYRIASP